MKVTLQVVNFYPIVAIAFVSWVSFSSCGSTKNITYFNDLPDSTHVFLPPLSKDERVIEYGDYLNISITAEEKDAVAYFNAQGGGAAPAGSTTAATSGSGYLVNPLGFIEFPIIGKIKVLGLTERKLKETLTQMIGKYVKDPMVDVHFNTFRITVLGDVNAPGNITLDMQRTTIFQALAAAGDLPSTAKRYDVQIYRDYNGERSIIKFDLRKKEVLYNPEVFEMKHNDVLYVQPLRNRLFREDFGFFTSILGLVTGFISLGFIIFKN